MLDRTRTALSTDIEKNLLETKSIKFLEFVNFESSSYREKVQFSIERILLAFDLACLKHSSELQNTG